MSTTLSTVPTLPEVADFLERHGLTDEFDTAVELVGRAFPGCPVKPEVVSDPDTVGGKYLFLNIAIPFRGKEGVERFNECDLEVARAIGPRATWLIHLTHTPADVA